MKINKEIMDMKNQLTQMMESLKQKDNQIFQNNQKLNVPKQGKTNSNNNNGINNNNLQMNGINNPQQFGNNGLDSNTLNNINSMGLNAYMQYTGINPFAQQQNNMMSINYNNQIGLNRQITPNKNQAPKRNSSVL